MISTNMTRFASVLSLSLLYACGGPGDLDQALEGEPPVAEAAGSEAPSGELTQQGTRDIAASVDVGYGTVHFLERKNADGTVLIGIQEDVPSGYVTTPLDLMLAEGHTHLEAFMALAPDQTPPDAYVTAHAAQAAALGRANGDIVPATFDPNAPIEKSTTHCKNVATPATRDAVAYTYSKRMARDDVQGRHSLTLNAGKKPVAPAICNEIASNKTSKHTVQGRVRMKPNGGSYDNPGWSSKLPPGWQTTWLGLQLRDSSHCRNWPDPKKACPDVEVDATYQLQGKSNTTSSANTYDLYMARIETHRYIGIVR